MKLTGWFPANVKPVRNGVYQINTPHGVRYSFYDDGFRYFNQHSTRQAIEQKGRMNHGHQFKWRGIAK